MSAAARDFEALRRAAEEDPDILAFWLDGSRGKGRVTAHSDYDCTLIVSDAVWPDRDKRWPTAPGLDLTVMTLGQFEAASGWGAPDAWNRYNYAHLAPLIDKTGRIATLMTQKACVPEAEADGFIRASLDHFTNQIYRALKCRRDGDAAAARLEAAEAGRPLLDALFALNGRRLRPYAKYLAWELEAHPLQHCPWPAEALPGLLAELALADVAGLRRFFNTTEGLFRDAGYGAVFDAWGDALAYLRSA